MNLPLVSVIVPSYCHEQFVLECLSSIYDQTYEALELVVVDDASTDATFERCEALLKTRFAARFSNVRLVRNDLNLGAHGTINRGISLSSGTYVAVINSDDRFHPDRISKMVAAMVAAGSDLSFTLVDILADPEEVNSVPGAFQLFTLKQMLALKRDLTIGFALLRSNQAVSTGNILFKRDLYDRIGPFLPLKYCHDWDFVLQALHWTEPVAVMEPLYEYRLHGANSFSSLAHLASVETEVVIRRFLRRCLSGRSPNSLCPSPVHWPGYFEVFIQECGYGSFFERENGEGSQTWRIYDKTARSARLRI